jgi:hypothetical protein
VFIKAPVLSILILTYDRVESLGITLNSIVHTSLVVEDVGIEIIVGGNSTNEHALHLVNRMSSSQSRVKIIL